MAKIVFVDMDGVIADFDAGLPADQKRTDKSTNWDPPAMFEAGFFRNLPVVPGAKAAVYRMLNCQHLDLYIGSKPTTKNLLSATEKYQWVEEHFPELLRKMVLVCDKALLRGDVLIDDDAERWGPVFKGQFIHFDLDDPEVCWKKIADELIGDAPPKKRYTHTSPGNWDGESPCPRCVKALAKAKAEGDDDKDQTKEKAVV